MGSIKKFTFGTLNKILFHINFSVHKKEPEKVPFFFYKKSFFLFFVFQRNFFIFG